MKGRARFQSRDFVKEDEHITYNACCGLPGEKAAGSEEEVVMRRKERRAIVQVMKGSIHEIENGDGERHLKLFATAGKNERNRIRVENERDIVISGRYGVDKKE